MLRGLGLKIRAALKTLIQDVSPSSKFVSNKLRAEWVLASFLDTHNIEYGVYSDFDLAFDYSIDMSDIIALNTHSEYWSSQMVALLRQFIEKGGKVVSLSGNNIYRQVRFSNGYIEVVNQGLPSDTTTELLGTFFDGTETEKERGYRVIKPKHWVFDGTNVENSIFGKYSANWGRANMSASVGCSGDETDQINDFTKGFITLAIGENKNAPAYMVFKETVYGGWVFNASSITFAGGLYHDKVIDRIVLKPAYALIPNQYLFKIKPYLEVYFL